MRKTLQKVLSFYLFLFLLPILMIKLPMLAFGTNVTQQVEKSPIAYAANVVTKEVTKEVNTETLDNPFDILLYFTHSHEAFHPIVEKSSGLKAVNYHASTNIMNVSALLTQHFQLNGASVDVLPYDNMKEMKASGHKFHEAYTTMRPVLKKQLESKKYDVIIDLHRDSLKREKTTIVSNGTAYAQIILVVGVEHENYKLNEAFSKAVSNEMNGMVPSISKGVLAKTHDTGNGIYNQDLSDRSLLVELGGIENTEEEINRTIAILSKAISVVFENSKGN